MQKKNFRFFALIGIIYNFCLRSSCFHYHSELLSSIIVRMEIKLNRFECMHFNLFEDVPHKSVEFLECLEEK